MGLYYIKLILYLIKNYGIPKLEGGDGKKYVGVRMSLGGWGIGRWNLKKTM